MTEDVVLENRARIKIRMDEAQFRWVKMLTKTEAMRSSLLKP